MKGILTQLAADQSSSQAAGASAAGGLHGAGASLGGVSNTLGQMSGSALSQIDLLAGALGCGHYFCHESCATFPDKFIGEFPENICDILFCGLASFLNRFLNFFQLICLRGISL